MPSLRRATFSLVLLAMAGHASAVAQCPGMENFKAPPVGGYSEYKSDRGTMRLALVGTETRGTTTYIRMEMGMTSQDGPMVMQMLVPGYPYEMSGIAEMVMQRGHEPAMRMPQQMLSMMASRMPKDMLSEACRDSHMARVGEESITVPAGTFRTIHFHDADKNSDVWISTEVPFGLVQTKGTQGGDIVLTGRGTDAKSSITGPIQDMPMH
jgi:hypothetical protein